jgi:hypothetical protein
MIHLTEEQLLFYYYGESGETLETEQHLDRCDECRAQYGSLQRLLNAVSAAPAPQRGPDYGVHVWQRIEASLPARRAWWTWAVAAPALRYSFAGGALVALLAVAFLAGRFYPRSPAVPPPAVADDTQISERVLRVAVGDYLDRSQIVLTELANANALGSLDISTEQERAQELVSETRLYRQTAAATGDTPIAAILDELELLLLDIARGPSKLSAAELERLRARLAAESILFKIRVVNSNVRSQEAAQAGDAPRQKL